jgi:hypothetical protein
LHKFTFRFFSFKISVIKNCSEKFYHLRDWKLKKPWNKNENSTMILMIF